MIKHTQISNPNKEKTMTDRVPTYTDNDFWTDKQLTAMDAMDKHCTNLVEGKETIGMSEQIYLLKTEILQLQDKVKPLPIGQDLALERLDNYIWEREERERQKLKDADLLIEELGRERLCAAALCLYEHDNGSTQYTLVNSKGGSKDYKEQERLCKGNEEALKFLEEHADLWDDIEEKKPLIKKDGTFSRTKAKENEWVGLPRVTKVKRHYKPTVVWAPVDGIKEWANMGSLKDGKLVKWMNGIIAKIRTGRIIDGRELFDHVKGVSERAPYGLKGRTFECTSQIWRTWKERKATIAVVKALSLLGK